MILPRGSSVSAHALTALHVQYSAVQMYYRDECPCQAEPAVMTPTTECMTECLHAGFGFFILFLSTHAVVLLICGMYTVHCTVSNGVRCVDSTESVSLTVQ